MKMNKERDKALKDYLCVQETPIATLVFLTYTLEMYQPLIECLELSILYRHLSITLKGTLKLVFQHTFSPGARSILSKSFLHSNFTTKKRMIIFNSIEVLQ